MFNDQASRFVDYLAAISGRSETKGDTESRHGIFPLELPEV
jgi:hypothetical protein